MYYYFKLRLKIINRYFRDFGLPPLIGYILTLVFFHFTSTYALQRLETAPYVYVAFAITLLVRVGGTEKRDFLKFQFGKIKYLIIKALENLMITLPFMIYLLFWNRLAIAFVLFLISMVLVFFKTSTNFNLVLPTPFYKHPFEFSIGFRKNFVIYIISYSLVYLSIISDNPNLGVFGVIVITTISSMNYASPESVHYVWIYSLRPDLFLKHKVRIGLLYTFFSAVPITVALCVFFPDELFKVLLIQFLGLLFVMASVLAKYSVFPKKMDIPQVLLILCSIGLPFLILIVIPYFNKKSKTRLKNILK